MALLSVAMLSCKKETKIVHKKDPVTGKTVQVEVPVESEKDLPAINDSADVYTQTFKLVNGETYPFTTVQKNNMTITAPNGQKQTMSTESTDVVNFKVNGFTNNIYDISIDFVSKKTTQSAQGKTVTVDTGSPAPKDEALKNKWNLDKALVGNKLNMKMDNKGKIISITGFDPVYKKLQSTINSLTKDAAARKGLLEEAKMSFSEKMLKDQFSKNMLILPAKGVKVGEKWTKKEDATPDGKVKLTTNYTLKNVDNGTMEVLITGGLPKQADKQTQNGITHIMSSELSQNGTVKFDTNTGWLLSQNIKVNTVQKESISDGKKTETMTNNTVSNVIVNP